MKAERRGRGKGKSGRGRREGNGKRRGEKTHLTPVASDLPLQMAKQETGLSSGEANLMRVLNSLALPVFSLPNVPTLFCSKWWELGDHTRSKLNMKTNNPTEISQILFQSSLHNPESSRLH